MARQVRSAARTPGGTPARLRERRPFLGNAEIRGDDLRIARQGGFGDRLIPGPCRPAAVVPCDRLAEAFRLPSAARYSTSSSWRQAGIISNATARGPSLSRCSAATSRPADDDAGGCRAARRSARSRRPRHPHQLRPRSPAPVGNPVDLPGHGVVPGLLEGAARAGTEHKTKARQHARQPRIHPSPLPAGTISPARGARRSLEGRIVVWAGLSNETPLQRWGLSSLRRRQPSAIT